MKPVLIGAISLGLAAVAAAPAFAEKVTVTVTGVKAQGGALLAALQTKDEFLQPKGHIGKMVKAPAKDGPVTIVLDDVPPGDYSLSVLHDADDDKQMKMVGEMPGEGWAMKNGSTLRAAPTWDVVKFTVGNRPVAITEPMIYPAN